MYDAAGHFTLWPDSGHEYRRKTSPTRIHRKASNQRRMRRRSKEYDAFRSYAHRDRQVTVAIQKGCTGSGGDWASCARCGCFAMTQI